MHSVRKDRGWHISAMVMADHFFDSHGAEYSTLVTFHFFLWPRIADLLRNGAALSAYSYCINILRSLQDDEWSFELQEWHLWTDAEAWESQHVCEELAANVKNLAIAACKTRPELSKELMDVADCVNNCQSNKTLVITCIAELIRKLIDTLLSGDPLTSYLVCSASRLVCQKNAQIFPAVNRREGNWRCKLQSLLMIDDRG